MNLAINSLSKDVRLLQPEDSKTFTVSPDDPATTVMTHFKRIKPFTISGTAHLDEVEAKMIACGVRLLFVTNGSGEVLGLITASDLAGERPIQYIKEHGGTYATIAVLNIMTSTDRLEAFNYTDIAKATVADLVKALADCNRQHMLVTDNRPEQSPRIVGIFSTTQIAKQLGKPITHSLRAKHFYEIEEALAQ